MHTARIRMSKGVVYEINVMVYFQPGEYTTTFISYTTPFDIRILAVCRMFVP